MHIDINYITDGFELITDIAITITAKGLCNGMHDTPMMSIMGMSERNPFKNIPTVVSQLDSFLDLSIHHQL